MPLRVVVDTNVRFSALLYGGAPRRLVAVLTPPAFLQIVSQSLLDEFRIVLARKTPWTPAQIETEISTASAACELVHPDVVISACRDPDDNRILECALGGHADVIISGDQDLLALNVFQSVRIVTIREFLDRYIDLALTPHTSTP